MEILRCIVMKMLDLIGKTSFQIFDNLGSEISNLFYSAFVLYFIIYGIMLITKRAEGTTKKFVLNLLIWTIAIKLATDSNLYKEYILDPILGSAIDISKFILKSVVDKKFADVDAFNFLDNAYKNLGTYSDKMKPTGNAITNLALYIEVYVAKFLLWGFFFFFALVFFTYTLVCWSLCYLLSMFAGIFLFLACFDKTREFFMNWIKTLIAAAFTIILSHSVLGLTVGSLDTAFSKLATSDISQGAFGDFFLMALLWCIVASLLMLMVPQVSQGITNVSFSIGGAAVTSAVGSAALTKTKLIGGKAAGYGYDTLKGGGAIQHGRQIYGGATNLLNKLRGVKG